MKSLQNNPEVQDITFNAEGYEQWMADNLTIIDKTKEEVALVPQPAQHDLLGHMSHFLLILILKARKMGFSSVCLAVAVAKFLLGKNEKCVSVSFDQTSGEKQLARAKHYIRSFERITGAKVPLKYNSKSEMVYEVKDGNGNVLYTNTLRVGSAKAVGFGRGDDITFLHITEVSLADDVQALLAGVGEAVVKGAHTILETTANGYNSYKTLWDESTLDRTGFAALFYSPEWEYSEEFLTDKERKLGKFYKQEYPPTPQDAFMTSGNPYFDQQALAEHLRRKKVPSAASDRYIRRFRDLQRGEFVLLFVDTAGGGGDYVAGQFLSHERLDVLQILHSEESITSMTPVIHRELERIYDATGVKPCVAFERNNGGAYELERLATLNRLGKYTIYQMRVLDQDNHLVPTGKLGWDTNSATRPKMLQEWQEAIDHELVLIYDEPTITEHFSFVVVKTSNSWKAQAEVGAHDDTVMAGAGVWQMYQTEKPPAKKILNRPQPKRSKFHV